MQDSVYDKFVALLVEKVKSTPTGDGFDEAVTNGPIVSERMARVRSVIYGGLTQSFDRSPKPNSTRYGTTLSPANRKGPKSWSAEKGVRAGAILSIPQVSLPTASHTKFDNGCLPGALTRLGKSSPMLNRT